MRSGPCMCGDTYCPSCGPAQGNYKCVCGEWTDDHDANHVEENVDGTFTITDPRCKHDDKKCSDIAQHQAREEEAYLDQLVGERQEHHRCGDHASVGVIQRHPHALHSRKMVTLLIAGLFLFTVVFVTYLSGGW